MNYVKVINPGNTYTTLGLTQSTEFWGAHITNNVLPIRGRTYMVIKELDHPNFSDESIMVIMDNNYTAFIVGIGAVVESNSDDFTGVVYEDEISQPEPVKIKQQKPMRPIPVKKQQKYEVGDIIIVTDRESTSFGKKLRVTDPNYTGYDVVTSYSETGNDKAKGWRFNQVEKYIPEPELLPEDKPKFSKNELLEVLNQINKTPEEMILDLMDHITN